MHFETPSPMLSVRHLVLNVLNHPEQRRLGCSRHFSTFIQTHLHEKPVLAKQIDGARRWAHALTTYCTHDLRTKTPARQLSKTKMKLTIMCMQMAFKLCLRCKRGDPCDRPLSIETTIPRSKTINCGLFFRRADDASEETTKNELFAVKN